MAAYLVCLSSGGGVPLFTRKTPEFKTLSFPVVGSLNGVHMFTRSHEATLISTTTKNAKIVWREFCDSVVLIVIKTGERGNSGANNKLDQFLEAVFHAMVFFIGLDDIVNVRNIERLKRDLRNCFGILDSLLKQLVGGSDVGGASCRADLLRRVDCILCPESIQLQVYLETFTESAQSTYGCLQAGGRVVCATRRWWELEGQEMALLSLYLASTPKTTCHDVPVFLPVGSPKVPHRLLVFQLIQGVEVCLLCGTTPTLTQLQKEVDRFWRGAYELLRSLSQYQTSAFSANVPVDKNVLGFLLINLNEHKSLCSVNPQGLETTSAKEDNRISEQQRFQFLRNFYKVIAGTVFLEDSDSDGLPESSTEKRAPRHSCTETYLCCRTHKFYAFRTDSHQIYVLYSSKVPTFALRTIAQNTFNALTKGKPVRL